MNRFLRALVGLALGYAVGVAIGAGLVAAFSANTHDKSVELVMTSAFVTGPIGAIIGALVAGLRR